MESPWDSPVMGCSRDLNIDLPSLTCAVETLEGYSGGVDLFHSILCDKIDYLCGVSVCCDMEPFLWWPF